MSEQNKVMTNDVESERQIDRQTDTQKATFKEIKKYLFNYENLLEIHR